MAFCLSRLRYGFIAQRSAVLASELGECLMREAGLSFDNIGSEADSVTVTDAAVDAGADAPCAGFSISSIGFILERMLGSLPISSGLDKSEVRISPLPEFACVGAVGVGGGEIFCRIVARISSCSSSVARFPF